MDSGRRHDKSKGIEMSRAKQINFHFNFANKTSQSKSKNTD